MEWEEQVGSHKRAGCGDLGRERGQADGSGTRERVAGLKPVV